MDDIYRKLSYLSKQKPSAIKKNNERDKKEPGLPGWNKNGKYIYSKKKTIALDELDIKEDFLTVTDVTEGKYNLNDIIFFDTETTGLSCGAGNYVFLLGIITIINNNAEIEQVFLSDFPGESEYINYISGLFPPNKLYVSYNGKSFDYHALKTRFLMNGKELTITNQLDLLYISRRFWKSIIGSCTLGNVEQKILNVYRDDDIPGFEIPDVYFDFLRYGRTEKLLKVFEHNLLDILSLVKLLFQIENIIINRTGKIIDNFGLGIYLEKNNQKDAVKQIITAFKKGNIKAGRYLSDYYKKNKDWDNALEIWNKLLEKNVEYAYIELAKYYEHRKKDPETALNHMLKLVNLRKKKHGLLKINFSGNSIKKTPDINKRINRLENKIKKN